MLQYSQLQWHMEGTDFECPPPRETFKQREIISKVRILCENMFRVKEIYDRGRRGFWVIFKHQWVEYKFNYSFFRTFLTKSTSVTKSWQELNQPSLPWALLSTHPEYPLQSAHQQPSPLTFYFPSSPQPSNLNCSPLSSKMKKSFFTPLTSASFQPFKISQSGSGDPIVTTYPSSFKRGKHLSSVSAPR